MHRTDGQRKLQYVDLTAPTVAAAKNYVRGIFCVATFWVAWYQPLQEFIYFQHCFKIHVELSLSMH